MKAAIQPRRSGRAHKVTLGSPRLPLRASSPRVAIYVSGAEPSDNVPVFQWNGYTEKGARRSVLRYCETHADKLRERYGQWVHGLAFYRIGKQRVVDAMATAGGLSAWWTTVFVEKSPFKSPAIVDAIKLLALEDLLVDAGSTAVDLYCESGPLRRSIAELCRGLGITVVLRNSSSSGRHVAGSVIQRMYYRLPSFVRGSITFARYFIARLPLAATGFEHSANPGSGVFICSYLFNLDPGAAKTGEFRSRYWEGLLPLLAEMNLPANWLHLYHRHDAVSSVASAQRLVTAFNQDRRAGHALLDSYASMRVARRVACGWFRLALASLRHRHRDREAVFRPQGSQASFWWLMREEWLSSWRGPLAVQNLIWIELFDAVLRTLPKQRAGFYLCENQGWERAFVHAWRKYGHGSVTAVPHSTRSFWDLRFYHDPRAFTEPTDHPLPRPDQIAVNGPAALDQFRMEHYPDRMLRQCEALRYGYLQQLQPRVHAAEYGRRRVLLLGEYSYETTVRTLDVLAQAAATLNGRFEFTLKPHPNAVQHDYRVPAIAFSVVCEPMVEMLHCFDIAICGSTTSASVDAYVAGLSVIIVVDPQALDFSPLRGKPDVTIVSEPQQLADALINLTSIPSVGNRPFFFIDQSFPRWRSLLSNERL